MTAENFLREKYKLVDFAKINGMEFTTLMEDYADQQTKELRKEISEWNQYKSAVNEDTTERVELIATLQNQIKELKEYNHNLIVAFGDFCKAISEQQQKQIANG